MSRLLIMLAILASAIALTVVGYKLGTHKATETIWSMQPGLSGETLRFNNDGTYVLQPWGDLPPYKPHRGRWYLRGKTLALVPREQDRPIRLLHKKSILGCDAWLTQKINQVPSSVFPTGVTGLDFTQTGTGCGSRIDAYNRVHSVAP